MQVNIPPSGIVPKHKASKRQFKAVVAIIVLIFAASGLLVSGLPTPPDPNAKSINGTIEDSGSYTNKKSIQIGVPRFVTFTPAPSPTAPPSPTPNCTESVAVDFLVDVSGSMLLPPSKLEGLKVALLNFANNLNDNSLVALHTFSGPDAISSNPPYEVISFTRYRSVKDTFASTVYSLTARGSTYTRDAFSFVKPKIIQAKSEYREYKKFALLFFSDGIPYIYPPKPSCDIRNPQTCFSPEQDPTEPPDISQEIKAAGIIIYSVAFNGDLDRPSADKLEAMMRRIASSNSHYYSAQESSDLSRIFNEIAEKVCL